MEWQTKEREDRKRKTWIEVDAQAFMLDFRGESRGETRTRVAFGRKEWARMFQVHASTYV